jgi:hypothetical protein
MSHSPKHAPSSLSQLLDFRLLPFKLPSIAESGLLLQSFSLSLSLSSVHSLSMVESVSVSTGLLYQNETVQTDLTFAFPFFVFDWITHVRFTL